MEDLNKLKRKELLEIMLEQQLLIEKQEKEIQQLKEALDDKKIKISKAGSIAEASLMLSGIFETAQLAADTYLENVKNLVDKRGVDNEKTD
ncbi:hypothetical protein HK298_10540 [Streptococcus agalactiae]|nr:hypothetical protein [Streptococcus agalactiae]